MPDLKMLSSICYHAKIVRNFVLPFSRFLHNSVLYRFFRKSGTMKKKLKRVTDRYWFTCTTVLSKKIRL